MILFANDLNHNGTAHRFWRSCPIKNVNLRCKSWFYPGEGKKGREEGKGRREGKKGRIRRTIFEAFIGTFLDHFSIYACKSQFFRVQIKSHYRIIFSRSLGPTRDIWFTGWSRAKAHPPSNIGGLMCPSTGQPANHCRRVRAWARGNDRKKPRLNFELKNARFQAGR